MAGDLVESARPCPRTGADLGRLTDWLASRGVSLDGPGRQPRSRPATRRDEDDHPRRPASWTLDGWTIAHGHRRDRGDRTISGHFHPTLRFEGYSAPCFLVGPGRIVLPAFSANAAGCEVLAGPVPRAWIDEGLRCIASTGRELLDFGPLSDIRRVRSSPGSTAGPTTR